MLDLLSVFASLQGIILASIGSQEAASYIDRKSAYLMTFIGIATMIGVFSFIIGMRARIERNEQSVKR